MPLFETLLAMDDDLVNWLIHASPTTGADLAKMKELFAVRAELDDKVNDLVAYRLKLAVAPLPDEIARLNAAASAMKSAAGTIDKIEDVLTAAGTAVSVAAKALAFVTQS